MKNRNFSLSQAVFFNHANPRVKMNTIEDLLDVKLELNYVDVPVSEKDNCFVDYYAPDVGPMFGPWYHITAIIKKASWKRGFRKVEKIRDLIDLSEKIKITGERTGLIRFCYMDWAPVLFFEK